MRNAVYLAQSKIQYCGLCALNIQTDPPMLGIDHKADLFEVLFDPISHKPLAFAVIHDRKAWTVIEPSIEIRFGISEYLG